MASKRKSSTPCMIPSKLICSAEESESRIPGGDRHSPLDSAESSKTEARDAENDLGGTYTCKPCSYQTPDLNLFLDHVYSAHTDFRADPGFVCVSCGVSASKFEGLALHNARVHPSTLNTSLRLRRRERKLVVEQSLTIGAEAGKDGEISITKTPIMKMLRGKSEAKRIVVPHLASEEPATDPNPVSRDGERKESAAVAVTRVPTIVHNGATKVTLPSTIQIVNGSTGLPVLKTPITQVVSVAQNRNLFHNAPITASSNVSSTSSQKTLPKVMIPLSSIPTYSASMDDSSFLKTSFSKFPYPTKAELCYLTVVTKFPEEQIKIWFTAQRLKQGISWSPEEIEEARRKMFNTIIQTAPATPHSRTLSHSGQHTIAVLPASLGAAAIPQFLHGSLVSQSGVIVAQPVVANGIHVSGAPVALAVTPKPQAAARPTMQARPAAAADKAVSGTSAGSNVISSSSASKTGGAGVARTGHSGAINLSLGSSSHSNGKASGANGKHGNGESKEKAARTESGRSGAKNAAVAKVTVVAQGDGKVATDNKAANGGKKSVDGEKSKAPDDSAERADSPSLRLDEASSPASSSSSPSPSSQSGAAHGSRSLLDASFYKGKKSPEQLNTLKDSFLVNQFPDQEEVDRLIALTGLTVREVRKWFSDRRYHFRNQKGARASAGSQSKAVSSAPVDLSDCHGSSNAPLSPAASPTPTSPSTPSRRLARPPSPDFTAIRYKEREPHQVRILEASFTENADPSGEEVERLRSETKMTRREIHGWFSERRKRAAAEKRKEEADQAVRNEEEDADGADRQKDDGLGEPKVNPIKINLKMLKVTASSGKAEAEGAEAASAQSGISPTSSSKPPQSSTTTPKASPSPKPAPIRGKKTAEQLHQLKQVYARTQWPNAAQYDELVSSTGLTRPEVVRWFGDSRYVQKNGQLKWLEDYQNTALREDLTMEKTEILQAHLEANSGLEESQLQELADVSALSTDLVRCWFSTKKSQLKTKHAAFPTTGSAAGTAGPAPAEPQPGGGTEEKMEQSVCGVATGEEIHGDKPANTAKVIEDTI